MYVVNKLTSTLFAVLEAVSQPHTECRQLRVIMARKDEDIMKLVGQVVTLQRNMFKPQRVQVSPSLLLFTILWHAVTYPNPQQQIVHAAW